MRILYDGFIFRSQRAGGINRYFKSIIARLPNDWEPTIRCFNRPGTIAPDHPRIRFQVFPFGELNAPSLSHHLCRAWARVSDAIDNSDLVHPTYHWLLPQTTIQKRKAPLVVTVYDMIPEIFSETVDPDGSQSQAKKSAVEAAAAVICISQKTKDDLQDRYRIPDSRIIVTHLASDLSRDLSFGDEAIPESPYVLFMGNRDVYKNFTRVLVAFDRIKQKWPELTLCVVGEVFNPKEIELIDALDLSRRIAHLGVVDDSHLAKLYRCSAALLYPSLYEGFGIPPLEAMTCGTVVITSNSASLPEVVGDAAIVVDPTSVTEIADAILSLGELGAERERLIAAGFERAKVFNWHETARRTIEVYRSVAG